MYYYLLQNKQSRVTHLSRRLISVNRNSIISSAAAMKKINKHGVGGGSDDELVLSASRVGNIELFIAKLPHSSASIS